MTDAQWDGRPERPEQGGIYWLRRTPWPDGTPSIWYWNAYTQEWVIDGRTFMKPVDVAAMWSYIEPVLTPSDHAAQLAAAREAALEEAANVCETLKWRQTETMEFPQTQYECAEKIRALARPAAATPETGDG